MIEARKAVGNPVLPTEFELLVDHIECRSRLAALRKLLHRALRDAKDYAPSEKHAANLIIQMNSTTALSRRLARELRRACRSLRAAEVRVLAHASRKEESRKA